MTKDTLRGIDRQALAARAHTLLRLKTGRRRGTFRRSVFQPCDQRPTLPFAAAESGRPVSRSSSGRLGVATGN